MRHFLLSIGFFLTTSVLVQASAYACNYWTNAGCPSSAPYCEWTPFDGGTQCSSAQLTSPQEKKQQLKALKEKSLTVKKKK